MFTFPDEIIGNKIMCWTFEPLKKSVPALLMVQRSVLPQALLPGHQPGGRWLEGQREAGKPVLSLEGLTGRTEIA